MRGTQNFGENEVQLFAPKKCTKSALILLLFVACCAIDARFNPKLKQRPMVVEAGGGGGGVRRRYSVLFACYI